MTGIVRQIRKKFKFIGVVQEVSSGKFCYLIKCSQKLKFRVVRNNPIQDTFHSILSKTIYNVTSATWLLIVIHLQPFWDPSSSMNNLLQHFPPSWLLFTASTWTMIFLTNMRRFTRCRAHYVISFNAPSNPMRYSFPNFTHEFTEAQRGHMTCQ